MAKKQKDRGLDHLVSALENRSVELRARMAERTAAEILYDECVVELMTSGHQVKPAILAANHLYRAKPLTSAGRTLRNWRVTSAAWL